MDSPSSSPDGFGGAILRGGGATAPRGGAEPRARRGAPGDPPALRIEGLSSGYGDVPIVREVGFAVERGEVLAIMGRNGAGKTTLVDSIAGLLPVSAGSIDLEGRDVTSLDASARARLGLGYVPQGRGIFARLSVEENLRMGAAIGGRPERADLERAFEWFPILEERRRQRAGTLSGGEQQMLAIGRVMTGSPTLLVLDEPSEGIQPSIVQAIARVIARQNREAGLTVLLVEQNVDLVYLAADRCGVMNKGSVETWLAPDSLADPRTVRRYLAL